MNVFSQQLVFITTFMIFNRNFVDFQEIIYITEYPSVYKKIQNDLK